MEANYYKNSDSVDEYIRMAEGHNGLQLIREFRKYLPKGSRVLEIGSGPGTDLALLKEDFDVTGSDFSEEFLDRLQVKEPQLNFLKLDAATLDTDEKFDGIYSNKVLHHLNHEELMNTVLRQCELLNPKGIVAHSFWKGEGSEIFKGLFVNYHTEEDIRSYFEPKFEVLVISNYAEFEAGDSLFMMGRKNGS